MTSYKLIEKDSGKLFTESFSFILKIFQIILETLFQMCYIIIAIGRNKDYIMTFILKSKTKLRVFSNNQMVNSIYSVKEDITLTIEEIYSGCVCVKYDINNYGMINIYGDKIVLVDSDGISDSKVVMYDYANSINHIIDLALKDGE